MSRKKYNPIPHRFILPKELKALLLEMHPEGNKNLRKTLPKISSAIWQFYEQNEDEIFFIDNRLIQYFKIAKRIGPTVLDRALGNRTTESKQSGCRIEVTDLVCKYVTGDLKLTFKDWLKLKLNDSLDKYLTPYYKKVKLPIDFYDYLYKYPKEVIDQEKWSDELQKNQLGIATLMSMFQAETEAQEIVGTHEVDTFEDVRDLQQLSHIYYNTLSTVEIIMTSHELVTINLDDVYVQRELQEIIIHRLIQPRKKRENEFILVEGEAGRGKTSLLWFLMTYLKEKKDELPLIPIFLKATELIDPSQTDLHNKIFSVSDLYRSTNKQLVLLVDTLDLILQEQKHIDQVRFLISKFQSKEIRIIATSRIQEAQYLKRTIHPIKVYTLSEYSPSELKEAIKKYTYRYAFRYKEHFSLEKEYQRILNLVDKELSLRKICLNPLTLRMIYSIYMPNKIPSNINVHRLYNDYWDKKVKQEYRPEVEKPTSTVNLSFVTRILALTLVKEGVTEIKRNEFLPILEYKKLEEDQLDMLINRGIVRFTKLGIGFFHQTFLEYAAGKAFIMDSNRSGISLLKKRIHFRSDNLFLLPIYEQLLIQAGIFSHYDVLIFEEIDFLVSSPNISANFSALSIYILINRKMYLVRDNIIQLINQKEECLRKYFELAPNIPQNRVEDLFEDLLFIWRNVKKDSVKFSFLNLLFRFVPFDFGVVKSFIEASNIQSIFYNNDKNEVGIHRTTNYIYTLSELLPQYFNWAWKQLVEFIKASPKDQKLHVQVFDAIRKSLEKNPDFCDFPATNLSRDLKDIYSHFHDTELYLELIESFGKLWLIEWAKGKEEIIFHQCWNSLNSSNIFEFQTKLSALATFLKQNPDFNISPFFEYFHSLSIRNKIIWSRVFVVISLLNNTQNYTKKGYIYLFKFLTQIICDHVKSVFLNSDQTLKTKADSFIALKACLKIRTSLLPKEAYKKLFSHPLLNDPQIWLETEVLGELIGPAYWAKIEVVESIVNKLLNINSKSEKEKKSLRILTGFLGTLVHQDPTASEFILPIYLQVKKYHNIADIIFRIDLEKEISSLEHLEEIRVQLIDSTKAEERRKGFAIYEKLLQGQKSPQPTINEFQKLYQEEEDLICKKKIVKIISFFYKKEEFENVYLFLNQEIRNKKVRKQDELVDYYISFLVSNSKYVNRLQEEIIQYILLPPHNNMMLKDRLLYFRPFLSNYLDANGPRKAIDILLEFFGNIGYQNFLGTSSIQDFSFRMQPIIDQVYTKIETSEKLRFIQTIPKVHYELGKSLIDIVFGYRPIDPQIEQSIKESVLLNSATLPDLKTHCNYHFNLHTRLSSKEKWIELGPYILDYS